MVLEAVYEQDFLDCSYGFRPKRSAHQALDALQHQSVSVRPPERIVTASLTHVEVALRRSVRQKWRKAVGLVAADVRGGCPQIRSRRQVVSCEVRPRPAIRGATMTNGASCNSQGVSITVRALDVSDVACVSDVLRRVALRFPRRR